MKNLFFFKKFFLFQLSPSPGNYLEKLPLELAEKILLTVSSRDIAAVVLAVPIWYDLISSPRFIRLHIQRFKSIDNSYLRALMVTFEKLEYKKERFNDDECSQCWHLPSGHCVNCLLLPHLLTEKCEKIKCYCVDHRDLWGVRDVIIWDPWCVCTSEMHSWPQCFNKGYELVDFDGVPR